MRTAGQIPPEAAEHGTVFDKVQAVSASAYTGGRELCKQCCINE